METWGGGLQEQLPPPAPSSTPSALSAPLSGPDPEIRCCMESRQEDPSLAALGYQSALRAWGAGSIRGNPPGALRWTQVTLLAVPSLGRCTESVLFIRRWNFSPRKSPATSSQSPNAELGARGSMPGVRSANPGGQNVALQGWNKGAVWSGVLLWSKPRTKAGAEQGNGLGFLLKEARLVSSVFVQFVSLLLRAASPCLLPPCLSLFHPGIHFWCWPSHSNEID